MSAVDSRYPERPTIATVNVTVLRNINGPEFNASLYQFDIDETAEMYTIVGQVFAQDLDVLVWY